MIKYIFNQPWIIALQQTINHCIVLHCIALYYVQHSINQSLYCIALYCIVLYCIVLYCIPFHVNVLHSIISCRVRSAITGRRHTVQTHNFERLSVQDVEKAVVYSAILRMMEIAIFASQEYLFHNQLALYSWLASM